MFFREISRILGIFLLYLSLIILLMWGISFAYDGFSNSLVFLETALISGILTGICTLLGKKSGRVLHRKESILLVAIIWLVTAGIACLPFVFSKTLTSSLDAYFEAMSALTTTGASVIPTESIDSLCKGLLFWRSFLQWLGGMGIIVLFITFLPALSMGGRMLYEAEMTGPEKQSLAPRLKKTASLLWKIYFGLTAAQILLLMITNEAMPFFDAVTLSFSTISTGGFFARAEGLSAYHNINTNLIVLLFMILGSVNFSLFFHFFKGKVYRIYEPEFLWYIFSILISVSLMTLILWGNGTYLFREALQLGSFQAVSAQSSTGFGIAQYELWPYAAQILLLLLMFIGGMSGSTSGGLKISRLLILFRAIYKKMEGLFRPDAIRAFKIGSKEIPEKTIFSVLVFFAVLVFFTALGTFLFILDGLDPETAFSSIATFINNGGLSFGKAAALGSYAFLPPLSKIISIIWMLLGRLEFFVLLVLAIPAFWKEK